MLQKTSGNRQLQAPRYPENALPPKRALLLPEAIYAPITASLFKKRRGTLGSSENIIRRSAFLCPLIASLSSNFLFLRVYRNGQRPRYPAHWEPLGYFDFWAVSKGILGSSSLRLCQTFYGFIARFLAIAILPIRSCSSG